MKIIKFTLIEKTPGEGLAGEGLRSKRKSATASFARIKAIAPRGPGVKTTKTTEPVKTTEKSPSNRQKQDAVDD
jgi:hypothetical protein